MGTHLVEVDGANLKRFAGGSATFNSYRGVAYSILDERDGNVNLTPAQALRIADAIRADQFPQLAGVTEDDRAEGAFPIPDPGCGGMTLRDYFAAHFPKPYDVRDGFAMHARLAYEYADELLLARKVQR